MQQPAEFLRMIRIVELAEQCSPGARVAAGSGNGDDEDGYGYSGYETYGGEG